PGARPLLWWIHSRSSAPPPGPRSLPTRRSSDLAVKLRGHVLPICLYGATSDDLPADRRLHGHLELLPRDHLAQRFDDLTPFAVQDRKSTRLNSSHVKISYAVFCLKQKTATFAAG